MAKKITETSLESIDFNAPVARQSQIQPGTIIRSTKFDFLASMRNNANQPVKVWIQAQIVDNKWHMTMLRTEDGKPLGNKTILEKGKAFILDQDRKLWFWYCKSGENAGKPYCKCASNHFEAEVVT